MITRCPSSPCLEAIITRCVRIYDWTDDKQLFESPLALSLWREALLHGRNLIKRVINHDKRALSYNIRVHILLDLMDKHFVYEDIKKLILKEYFINKWIK